MDNEKDLEQKRQLLKLGTALAENDKFTEALSSIKPIPVLPNVSRVDRLELTYLANEQAMHAMTDALKTDPQVWSDLTSLWANLGEQIAEDVERMGAKLIELGFPDPRIDHSNWRIIAIMVGAEPDGLMDDIFEHAIAYHAKRQQAAKQIEAPENKPAAPVVVPAEPSGRLLNCLSPDGLTLRWGGVSYPLTQVSGRLVRLLINAFDEGFQYQHEEYLKTEGEFESDIRNIVRDGGLGDIVIREIGESGKVIKGKWGLIDPKKVSLPR